MEDLSTTKKSNDNAMRKSMHTSAKRTPNELRKSRVGSMVPTDRRQSRRLSAIQNAYIQAQISEQTAVELAAFDPDVDIQYNDAVVNQSMETQLEFRLKHYGMLTLQLACVLLFFHLLKGVDTIDGSLSLFFGLGYLGLVLCSVYCLYSSPLNLLLVLLLTGTQALFAISIRAAFFSPIPQYVLELTVANMLLVTWLSQIKVKAAAGEKAFLSDIYLAVCASPLSILLVLRLFMFKELQPFPAILMFLLTLLLLLWFTYDASCVRKKIKADDLVQGLLFFYTDMILIILFFIILFAATLVCGGTAGLTAEGGIGARSGEDPEEVES